jgi:cellulose biosynthesis protein BcsQ
MPQKLQWKERNLERKLSGQSKNGSWTINMASTTNTMTRHRSQRISIFNHKGGVGKTTLTVNIAAALASKGHRVLLVDSDPQCNLTSYLIDDKVVDDLLDHSNDEGGQTLWSAVKPISDGTGNVRAIGPIELSMKNLFLIPGDIQLADFEQDLNQLWSECFQRKIRGLRGTAALSSVVNLISSKLKIDYVFYDSGPNIGPLNRAILLDCDHFVVPAACDLFSVRALKTLGHTLAGWIKDWNLIAELAPDDVYLLPGLPKFLGYIPQRFRVYRGQVTSGQASYLSQIERRVTSDIVNVLREIQPSLASKSMSHNKLGLIKDFGNLATASQTQGVPIRDVDAGTAEQRDQADSAFRSIADKIIERT